MASLRMSNKTSRFSRAPDDDHARSRSVYWARVAVRVRSGKSLGEKKNYD